MRTGLTGHSCAVAGAAPWRQARASRAANRCFTISSGLAGLLLCKSVRAAALACHHPASRLRQLTRHLMTGTPAERGFVMTAREISRVGMIGLGKMGLPIGRHLVQRGFAVTGFDVALSALKAAASAGMKAGNSPKAVAAARELGVIVVGFDSGVVAPRFRVNGGRSGR